LEGITIGDPNRNTGNRFLWKDVEAVLFSARKSAWYFRIKIRDGAIRPSNNIFTQIQHFLLRLSGYPPYTMPLRFFDITQEELTGYLRLTAPASVHIS
jgi:hypothetical protein